MNPLLRTKLAMPQLRPPLVPRPALLARLEQGAAGKLTLIAAPAGYGKTTLVAQWLSTRHNPVAWVSLDAEDNDPVRFWRYVLTACRAFDDSLGKTALAQLRSAQRVSLETLLTSFINELAQLPARGILVLEDYHLITSPSIHESVAFLLDHLPDTVHVVMITRSEPPLFLARLRARNQVAELNSADLQFSREETQVFLEQILPVSPSPEMIARLEAQSEGWAAGLRLMALAVEGKRDPAAMEQFLGSLSGGHRHIVEYLTAEVLAAQPEPLQAFLLQTSLFPRLTASLCDAVTDRKDSAFLLAQLERGNLFVMPLGDQGWYRYHTLFAEAMRHSARERFGEEGVRTLYARASVWYEEHGRWDQAVEAAIAGHEYTRAADLIERSMMLHDLREAHTLLRWAGQLPEPVLHAHPALCFNHALAILFTSDRHSPATAARLEVPLRAAEEVWTREHNLPRLGQVFSARATVALWQGDLAQSFALAHQALERLSEDDATWRSNALLIVGLEERLAGRVDSAQQVLIESRALGGAAQNIHARLAATLFLGETWLEQGELDQAQELFEQVLAEAVGGEEMLDDQGFAHTGLAAAAYERNDLETAAEHAVRALELGVQRSDEEIQVRASLLLARVEQARGERAQALKRLQAQVAQAQQPRLVREILLWQARLALAAGEVAAAQRRLTARALPVEQATLRLEEQETLLAARLQIAGGESQAALKQLAPWRRDARAHRRTRSETEILALQALAYSAAGEPTRAAKALALSLSLAQPRSLVRVFLDEGKAMQLLIADFRLQIEEQSPRLRAYLYQLLAAFTNETSARARKSEITTLKSEIPFEPLSPQEQRVLRLLAAGLSNPEIARELVVSTNTIKTQVKSIYRKLNVSTREEARAAARELSLG